MGENPLSSVSGATLLMMTACVTAWGHLFRECVRTMKGDRMIQFCCAFVIEATVLLFAAVTGSGGAALPSRPSLLMNP